LVELVMSVEGSLANTGRCWSKNPSDPVLLYLAARAEYGWQTSQAVAYLKQAIRIDPNFAPAHLLLARIHSAPGFDDPKEAGKHMDLFSDLCPLSVLVYPELRWSKDRELLARTAARVRKALVGRTDAEAAAAYRL
jgi:hypothetical protein